MGARCRLPRGTEINAVPTNFVWDEHNPELKRFDWKRCIDCVDSEFLENSERRGAKKVVAFYPNNRTFADLIDARVEEILSQ